MGMTTLRYDKRKRTLIGNLACIICGYQWVRNWTSRTSQWKVRWEECPNCGQVQELVNPLCNENNNDKKT